MLGAAEPQAGGAGAERIRDVPDWGEGERLGY